MDKHPEEYEDCLERFESILMELTDFIKSTPYTPNYPRTVVPNIGPTRICCDHGGSGESGECEGCKFQRKGKCMLNKLDRLAERVLDVCNEELESREYTGKITISPEGFDIEANFILPDNGKSFAILQCAVDEVYQKRYGNAEALIRRIHTFLVSVGKSDPTYLCSTRRCGKCPLDLTLCAGLCTVKSSEALIEILNTRETEILCNLELFCTSTTCGACHINYPDDSSCLFGDVTEYYEILKPRTINFKVTSEEICITGASVQSCNILKPAFEEIQKCISR